MFFKTIIAAMAFASAANGIKFSFFIPCDDDSDCPANGPYCITKTGMTYCSRWES